MFICECHDSKIYHEQHPPLHVQTTRMLHKLRPNNLHAPHAPQTMSHVKPDQRNDYYCSNSGAINQIRGNEQPQPPAMLAGV